MKVSILLSALLTFGCATSTLSPVPPEKEKELEKEAASPGDLSDSVFLQGPDAITSSTFAEAVSITATYEIINQGETADCTSANSGPIVSFHLYEGDIEIASSIRGVKFLQSQSSFEIPQGKVKNIYLLQNLKISEKEKILSIPAGSYTLVAVPHFHCGSDESPVRFDELDYAFAVTKQVP